MKKVTESEYEEKKEMPKFNKRSYSSDKSTTTPRFIDEDSDDIPKTIVLKKSN